MNIKHKTAIIAFIFLVLFVAYLTIFKTYTNYKTAIAIFLLASSCSLYGFTIGFDYAERTTKRTDFTPLPERR